MITSDVVGSCPALAVGQERELSRGQETEQSWLSGTAGLRRTLPLGHSTGAQEGSKGRGLVEQQDWDGLGTPAIGMGWG